MYNSLLHSSDYDMSVTFMTTVHARFTTAQLPTPCFRDLSTNSKTPTITMKTRIYHSLTTAIDAEFIGNTERTRRLSASQLTVGTCAYSERIPFALIFNFCPFFFHILKPFSCSMHLSKGNYLSRLWNQQKSQEKAWFGNGAWSFEFTWVGNKMGGLASRFRLSHSTMSKILKHKETMFEGR